MAAVRLDRKLLGNLEKYGGPEDFFPSFKFSFEAYVGSQSEALLDHMTRSEQIPAEISMRVLSEEERGLSRSLYFVLTQALRGPALVLVMNVERHNGFEMWRRLVRREMPTSGVTLVGMIMTMVKFKIGSDTSTIVDKAEELEGMMRRYESAASEVLSDNFSQAILQSALPEELADRLTIQQFARYADLKDALINLVSIRHSRGTHADSPAPQEVPMEVGWIGYADKSSKGKSKGKGKGKRDKGKGSSGKEPEAPAAFQGHCDWCWLWGHAQRQCPTRKQFLAEQRWSAEGDKGEDMDVGAVEACREETEHAEGSGIMSAHTDGQPYVF